MCVCVCECVFVHTPLSLDRFKEAVVEERRRSAELLLQFAISCPHLTASSPLRLFLAVSGVTSVCVCVCVCVCN